MRITPRSIAVWFGIPVLSIAVIGGLVYVTRPSPTIVIKLAPTISDHISTNGSTTVVTGLDGKVIERHVPYADRGIGHQFFRPDGSIRETTEHYPPNPGQTSLVLKSKGTFSEDGKGTLLLGEFYRPTGKLWFTLKDLGTDDKVEETYFFNDGWRFSTTVRKKGETHRGTRTYFHRTGNIWAKETFESNSEKTLEVFDATGKRLLYKLNVLGYQEEVDGFRSNTYGRLYTFYNEEGKATHRQWMNNWWNGQLQIQGMLQYTQVLDTSTATVLKTIEVEDTDLLMKVKTVSYSSGARKELRMTGPGVKRLALEKFDVNGTIKEKQLEIGTVSYELDASAVRIDHPESARVYDSFDLKLLMRADEKELRDRRIQSQAEDRAVFGPRDDSDPVKWYHK